jgi:hypothetical protein
LVGLPQLNARLTQIAREWVATIERTLAQHIISAHLPGNSHEQEALFLKRALLINGSNLESAQTRQFFEIQADGSVYCHLSKEMMNHLATPDANDAQTSIGRVFEDDIDERDRYLLRLIAQVAETGKQPLVIYGGSHIVKIEPALEAL